MSELLTYEQVVEQLRGGGRCCGVVNPNEYHAWKKRLAEDFGCAVVSKSTLHDFALSPFRYRYNELNSVRKETKGLRIGSMVDCKVLTPMLWGEMFAEPWVPVGEFAEPWKPWEPQEEKRFALKKNGEPSKNQDPDQKAEWEAAKAADKEAKAAWEQRKEAAEAAFYEECERRGVTLTKPDEVELAEAVAQQATAHLAEVGLVLGRSFVSQLAMWLYVTHIDGEQLPCPLIVTGMADVCPMDDSAFGDALMDLKTTAKDPADAQQLFYAMEDWHYGLGAALYLDLYNLCAGAQRTRFGHLFVGTQLPALSRLVWLGDAELAVFREDYKALLRRYALAVATQDWGEPTLEPVFYQPTYKEGLRFSRVMLESN